MNVSPLKAEPRSAEAVHSCGELVTPRPVHSGGELVTPRPCECEDFSLHNCCPPPNRAGMEKASLHYTVLLLVPILWN